MNNIIITGNLTKDPEIKTLPSGTAVCNFTVAVTSRVKIKDEWQDETLFITVVAFGKAAENHGKFLSKGSKVLASGRLKERTWESNGEKKSKMEIMTDQVEYLSKKEGASGQSKAQGSAGGDFQPYEDPF